MSKTNPIRIVDSERKAITASISFKDLPPEILDLILPELEHGAGIPNYDHSELFVKVTFASDNVLDFSIIVKTYYKKGIPDTTEIFCTPKNITKKILYKIITSSNSCIPTLVKSYQEWNALCREGA